MTEKDYLNKDDLSWQRGRGVYANLGDKDSTKKIEPTLYPEFQKRRKSFSEKFGIEYKVF